MIKIDYRERHHRGPSLIKPARDVAADKTRGAGDQDRAFMARCSHGLTFLSLSGGCREPRRLARASAGHISLYRDAGYGERAAKL